MFFLFGEFMFFLMELKVLNYKVLTAVLLASCVLPLSVEAAEYEWGGAGSESSPISWNDTTDGGDGVNADADHWNNAAAPILDGTDNVIISSGGLQHSGNLNVDYGSTLDFTGGYLSTIIGGTTKGLVVGSNTVSAPYPRVTIDGGQLKAQWITIMAGSKLQFKSGTITLWGANEPIAVPSTGYIDFTGNAGVLSFPNKSESYIEGKILSGIIRIDGVQLTTVGESVNDKVFSVSATSVTLNVITDKRAIAPVPQEDAEDVYIDQSLNWSVLESITACDVYFGADPVIENKPKVIEGTLQTSHVPEENLLYDTTYYWRVDTYEEGNPVPYMGHEWSFTTRSAPGLVAHWKLDEGEGSTTIAAVGSPDADGALGADVSWTTTGLAPVPTGTAAAVVFDAGNDPEDAAIIVTGLSGVGGSNPRSISAWIKADVTQDENAIIVGWGTNSDSQRYSFRLDTAGALRIEIQGGYAIATTPLNNGQWHHVVVTHSAGADVKDAVFYVDGAPDPVSSFNAKTINTGDVFAVSIGGSLHSAGYNFDGAIDEVRIYDYALSAFEVEDLYLGVMPRAVDPDPAVGELHVLPTVQLQWEVLNATAPTFKVNIGTDTNCNDILQNESTGSQKSYTIPEEYLDFGTSYYWRVDVEDGGKNYPGHVFWLTTGGKATDPVPADGATAYQGQRHVSWSGDEIVASYRVYVGSDNPSHFVGDYADTTVDFRDMAKAFSLVKLIDGSTYSWRVDCLDAHGEIMTTGDIWSFSLPAAGITEYSILDDFDGYVDDNDLLSSWLATSGASVVLEELTNIMEYSYDCGAFPFECEARRTFVPSANWKDDDLRSLQVNFRGDENNQPELMRITLSDGTETATVYHDDAEAVTDYQWQVWDIDLDEFANVDTGNIVSVTIGFGDGSSAGGKGLVRFNDILLYPGRCIEGLTAAGDFNGDCAVDMADLILIAYGWLRADYTVTAEQPDASALRAFYRFDEASGVVVADSSPLANDAVIEPADAAGMWRDDGQTGGCVQLDNNVSVEIPPAVFDDIDGVVTISMWVNGQASDFGSDVTTAVFTAGAVPVEENVWDRLLWDIEDVSSYAGRWNHYAFVTDIAASGVMSIYCNGVLVARDRAAVAVQGALSGDSVLRARFSDDSTVKIDELRVYDYALTHGEIVYLAAAPGAQIVQPISPVLTDADSNADGKVDMVDFSEVVEKWMSECLWPE